MIWKRGRCFCAAHSRARTTVREWKAFNMYRPAWVYHEEIINGNRTRVKTMIPLLFVKDERYEVVYEGAKRCYVPVEDEGEITFMSYPQFLTWIMEKVRPAAEETAG